MNLYGIKHCFNKIISLCAIFANPQVNCSFYFLFTFGIVLRVNTHTSHGTHHFMCAALFIYKGHIRF